jgi:hypothetical protein
VDDPVVAAAVDVAEGEDELGEADGLADAVWDVVVGGAGRNDQRRLVAGAGAQAGDPLGAERLEDSEPPELVAERPHQGVPDLEDGAAVPGLPGFGGGAEQPKLDGEDGCGLKEGVDAGAVGVQHGAGLGVEGGVVGAGAFGDPGAAHQDVLIDAGRPDVLGPAAGGAAAVVLHVPESILGVDVPLPEEDVVRGGGFDVGDAEAVADGLDGALEAGQVHGAVVLGNRRGEVFTGDASGRRQRRNS